MSSPLSIVCMINAFFIKSLQFVLTWIKTTLQSYILISDNTFFSNVLRIHVANTVEPLIDVSNADGSALEEDSDEALFYATARDQAFQQRQQEKFNHFNEAIDTLRASHQSFLRTNGASSFSRDPYASHFPDVADIFSTNLINKNFRLHFD